MSKVIPKVTNDDLKERLFRIRADIIAPYPFTEENSEPGLDSRYLIAMGFIYGVITEALASVREDRPIRLSQIGFKENVLKYYEALESKKQREV